MDYLKRLHRQCLVSRKNGCGGLDELGCRCEYCKIDIRKFRQWNRTCRQLTYKERKEKDRAKCFGQSNANWMKNYAPYSNNMDQNMLDFLISKMEFREKTSIKQRNSIEPPKIIYNVQDVPGFRVPIYRHAPNPTL